MVKIYELHVEKNDKLGLLLTFRKRKKCWEIRLVFRMSPEHCEQLNIEAKSFFKHCLKTEIQRGFFEHFSTKNIDFFYFTS